MEIFKAYAITGEAIVFNNNIVITYEHDQDCCEHVYCDFESLLDTTFMDTEFDDIIIAPVEGSGFTLNGFFVPCYDIQNGYYSSDLILNIDYPNGQKTVIDLNEINCIEHIRG